MAEAEGQRVPVKWGQSLWEVSGEALLSPDQEHKKQILGGTVTAVWREWGAALPTVCADDGLQVGFVTGFCVADCPDFMWIELTSFVVADMMVWVTPRRKSTFRTLTTELLQSSAAQSQGHFCFSFCPESECAGGAQEAGRGQNEDRYEWGILYRVTPHRTGKWLSPCTQL